MWAENHFSTGCFPLKFVYVYFVIKVLDSFLYDTNYMSGNIFTIPKFLKPVYMFSISFELLRLTRVILVFQLCWLATTISILPLINSHSNSYWKNSQNGGPSPGHWLFTTHKKENLHLLAADIFIKESEEMAERLIQHCLHFSYLWVILITPVLFLLCYEVKVGQRSVLLP